MLLLDRLLVHNNALAAVLRHLPQLFLIFLALDSTLTRGDEILLTLPLIGCDGCRFDVCRMSQIKQYDRNIIAAKPVLRFELIAPPIAGGGCAANAAAFVLFHLPAGQM